MQATNAARAAPPRDAVCDPQDAKLGGLNASYSAESFRNPIAPLTSLFGLSPALAGTDAEPPIPTREAVQ
jgi:hypothetical protein